MIDDCISRRDADVMASIGSHNTEATENNDLVSVPITQKEFQRILNDRYKAAPENSAHVESQEELWMQVLTIMGPVRVNIDELIQRFILTRKGEVKQ